jgi:hypothetical protein
MLAVWEELTAATVALNDALVAYWATVMVEGTVTDELLLASATAYPPAGAWPFRFTAQLSVPALDMEEEVQVTEVKTPTSAALMFTVRLPADELLPMVRIPVKGPPFIDVNERVSDAVWPGFNVSGVVIPEAEKSEPTTDNPEMVTGAFPLEVSVTVWVATLPTVTVPKFTLVELTVSVGVAGASWSEKVLVALPAVAVIVAVCEEDTAATDAENAADVEPAAMTTEAGTVTELLLLAMLTAIPPAGAGAFRLTVQPSVAAPVMDPFAQVKALRAGLMPAPVMFTVRLPVEELLAMVMMPV